MRAREGATRRVEDAWHSQGLVGSSLPALNRGTVSSPSIESAGLTGIEAGDYVLNPAKATLAEVTSVSGGNVGLRGVLDMGGQRGIIPTTALDLVAGASGSAWMNVYGAPVLSDTLILNTSTGAFIVASSKTEPSGSVGYCTVSATGIGHVFAGGTSLSASSPLSIANDTISIDLSAYATLAGATFTGAVSGIAPTADANFATKKYVDDAIATLDDLSGVSF